MKFLFRIAIGDVCGKFHDVFTKCNSFQEKNGTFDAVFCVGKFFSESIEYDGADSQQSMDWFQGKKQILIPTYFIDCTATMIMEKTRGERTTICPNLTFLGKFGVVEIAELTIVYLSGVYDKFTFSNSTIYSPMTYNSTEVAELESLIRSCHKCDIILTCEWSSVILNNLESHQKTNVFPQQLSPIVSKIAKIDYRYHFGGLEGVFYERPPYIGSKNGPPCRFVGLGAFGSSEKSIYAASISEIPVQVSNPAPSPYSEYSGPDRVIKKAEKYERRRDVVNVSDLKCWFCLSNPELEKHLLVSIGDQSYLAFPKGGISNEHLLLISMNHCNSYVDLSDKAVSEMEKTLNGLRSHFAKENKSLLIFERNIKYNKVPLHMHLQIISISNDLMSKCETLFSEEFTLLNAQYKLYDASIGVKDAIADAKCDGSNYFLVILPDQKKLIHRIQSSREMLNFGRSVVTKLLSCPDREDWKKCVVSLEDETKLVLKFRKQFNKV